MKKQAWAITEELSLDQYEPVCKLNIGPMMTD